MSGLVKTPARYCKHAEMCSQTRPGRPMKARDVVLANDRKKLGVDTAVPNLDRKKRGIKFYKKSLALLMSLLNDMANSLSNYGLLVNFKDM